MTDKTLNQLAADAIEALALFNAENARQSKVWQASIKAGGYAAHFRQGPEIADHLQMELLENIVFYDDDAKGALEELRFQAGTDDDGNPLIDICGYAVNTPSSRNANRAFDDAGVM